jgi:hypothetical protein
MPNAKDDVPTSLRTRSLLRPILIAWAVGGAIVFLVAATPFLPRFSAEVPWNGPLPRRDLWPGAPRTGESAALARHGDALRVLATDASRAEAVARTLSIARTRENDPFLRARRNELARTRAAAPIGPLPALAPEADAAAWLRAWQAVGHAYASGAVIESPALAPTATSDAANPSAEQNVTGDVAASAAVEASGIDAESVRAEIVAESERDRAWLHARERVGDRSLSATWRGRWDARASEIDARATALEASLTPFQRELVIAALPERAFVLASIVPTPSSVPAPEPGRARPLAGLWLGVALAGAALGTWFGLRVQARARRRAPARVESVGPPRTVASSDSWLHVVSGPNAGSLVRGAFDVCGCLVNRNHRVLLIECGRELSLHVVIGGERRWGLMECLADHTPVLGLVQEGGRSGLYVLTYGGRARSPRWPQLGRLLDEVRPHFGRVVLAIPAGAPRALGDAFQGRVLDAWWSGRLGFRGAAKSLDERLGIRFVPLQLEPESEAFPELETVAEPRPEPEPTMPPAVAEPMRGDPAVPATPAIVLDCELRVRERLRFLLWMRRVQRAEPEPAGSAPAR